MNWLRCCDESKMNFFTILPTELNLFDIQSSSSSSWNAFPWLSFGFFVSFFLNIISSKWYAQVHKYYPVEWKMNLRLYYLSSAIHMYQAGSGCIYNLRFSGIEEDATNDLQIALSIGPLCCDTFLSFSFSSSTFTFPFVVFFYTFPCTYPDLHICTWPPATTWFRSVFPIRGLWTFSIPLHTHLMPWRQSIFFVL